MATFVVPSIQLPGKRRDRVSQAMVLVSAGGTFAAATGLLFSGRFDSEPDVMCSEASLSLLLVGVCGNC